MKLILEKIDKTQISSYYKLKTIYLNLRWIFYFYFDFIWIDNYWTIDIVTYIQNIQGEFAKSRDWKKCTFLYVFFVLFCPTKC